MSPLRTILLLCSAEALAMAGFSAVPALLPTLQSTWNLSAGQAGVLGGSYFAGYICAISWLSGLTDRVDARKVFAFGALLGGIGSLAFATLAQGFWSACLCQALSGAGLAGTYMPGLRALTDRVESTQQSRFIAFYTSTFGIGASLSYACSGWISNHWGWPVAFAVAGVQPLIAGVAVWTLAGNKTPATRPRHSVLRGQWLALRDSKVRYYVLGYAAHCWELFGFRAWIVALLAYAGTQSALPTSAANLAALINLVGIPASIFGNESATRGNRRRHVFRVMLLSGLLAWLSGLAAPHPVWLIVILPLYFWMVMADSAALTAGLVASTNPQARGAAMAVYSLAGFGGGLLAPMVVGWLLDRCGGQQAASAWLVAWGSLGLWGIAHALSGRWRSAQQH
ncbi:MAG: MFS transporter [Betaproteobacteria bacterium]|nr:MFS transporter [Betaproteobacteria bacterium]